jgi:fluoroquinolone resistance protein
MEDLKLFDPEFIRDSKFNGIDISDSILFDKEFYKCSFVNCNLNKVEFENCRFEDCDFNYCDLSLVRLKSCEFIDARFYESKLLGINWTDVRTPIRIEFRKCKLNHSTFFGLNLRSIIIEDCIANEVDFTDAALYRANCIMTDFKDSKFSNTDLSYADFALAKNYDIDPNYNKIKRAIFSIPEVLTLLQGFDIVIK